jgi:hypothetical protein
VYGLQAAVFVSFVLRLAVETGRFPARLAVPELCIGDCNFVKKKELRFGMI